MARSSELKLQRAKKHINDLRACLRAFNERKPYRIHTRHPHPQVLEYCLTVSEEIPLDVALIAGDAVQNLRSALDHLAVDLVRANGNTPDKQTAFPIFKTFDQFRDQAAKKIRLMRTDAQNHIAKLEPFLRRKGRGSLLFASIKQHR